MPMPGILAPCQALVLYAMLMPIGTKIPGTSIIVEHRHKPGLQTPTVSLSRHYLFTDSIIFPTTPLADKIPTKLTGTNPNLINLSGK
ncbi:1024_t:CDS:2 [Ambispora leptoticha]|uniref:1024_t:CDS:1 n=1 Tax=Ambispora leptoticha TaxID=144679 RepID=A0A9N9BND3_9GLOM|nr:1024_t:CDS:2 [Ambispora leptoticha]